MIHMDKINEEIRFSSSQSTVEVHYMFARVHYEFVGIVCTHRNDNLFPRRAFSHYIDPRLGFVFIVKNSLVDFFNFLFNNLGKFFLILKILPIFLDDI